VKRVTPQLLKYVQLQKVSPAKGRMIIEAISSEVGVENFATAYNHGPVFLDEIDELLRTNDLPQRIMRLTNGGRVIFDKDNTFKQPNVWNGMFFTTSNQSLRQVLKVMAKSRLF
jgi:uncharacterized protein (DUF927 family)